jgi:hypothetical protein
MMAELWAWFSRRPVRPYDWWEEDPDLRVPVEAHVRLVTRYPAARALLADLDRERARYRSGSTPPPHLRPPAPDPNPAP